MFSDSPDATGHGFIFQLMHLVMISESSNALAIVSDLPDVPSRSLKICLMPLCMVLDPIIHLAIASDPPDVHTWPYSSFRSAWCTLLVMISDHLMHQAVVSDPTDALRHGSQYVSVASGYGSRSNWCNRPCFQICLTQLAMISRFHFIHLAVVEPPDAWLSFVYILNTGPWF